MASGQVNRTQRPLSVGRASSRGLFLGCLPALILHLAAIEAHSGQFGRRVARPSSNDSWSPSRHFTC